MKYFLLLLCVSVAGCGSKSKEEIAKELVKEYLKISMPNFDTYESNNFGTLGSAFLPFEETGAYTSNAKTVKVYKDSVAILESLLQQNKTTDIDKIRLQQLQDSIKVAGAKISTERQGYTPEKLYKISHSYQASDKGGLKKLYKQEFYIDKDLKKIVKETTAN